MNIYAVIFITLVASLIASCAQLLFKTGLRKRITSIRDMLVREEGTRPSTKGVWHTGYLVFAQKQ